MPLYSIAEQFKTAHWYYLWSLDARCYHWRHFVYISFFPCLIIHPLFFICATYTWTNWLHHWGKQFI